MEIHYLPDERSVESAGKETILEASLRAGIPHTHVCGGMARCSTCRVLVLEGLEGTSPRSEKEMLLAEQLAFPPNIRLACQTQFTQSLKIRRLVLDEEDASLTSKLIATNTEQRVGHEKKIGIMFTDIRDFTRYSELLPPYDVIHILNRYFSTMSKIVIEHDGLIDKYIGDGMMILFGVADQRDFLLSAVRAGLAMLEALASVNDYIAQISGQHFQMGIGLHVGPAVIGSVGYGSNNKLTAIGDSVNFASRIESENKAASTNFLISTPVYDVLRNDLHIGKILSSTIRGKSGEHKLYEVLALK